MQYIMAKLNYFNDKQSFLHEAYSIRTISILLCATKDMLRSYCYINNTNYGADNYREPLITYCSQKSSAIGPRRGLRLYYNNVCIHERPNKPVTGIQSSIYENLCDENRYRRIRSAFSADGTGEKVVLIYGNYYLFSPSLVVRISSRRHAGGCDKMKIIIIINNGPLQKPIVDRHYRHYNDTHTHIYS